MMAGASDGLFSVIMVSELQVADTFGALIKAWEAAAKRNGETDARD